MSNRARLWLGAALLLGGEIAFVGNWMSAPERPSSTRAGESDSREQAELRRQFDAELADQLSFEREPVGESAARPDDDGRRADEPRTGPVAHPWTRFERNNISASRLLLATGTDAKDVYRNVHLNPRDTPISPAVRARIADLLARYNRRIAAIGRLVTRYGAREVSLLVEHGLLQTQSREEQSRLSPENRIYHRAGDGLYSVPIEGLPMCHLANEAKIRLVRQRAVRMVDLLRRAGCLTVALCEKYNALIDQWNGGNLPR